MFAVLWEEKVFEAMNLFFVEVYLEFNCALKMNFKRFHFTFSCLFLYEFFLLDLKAFNSKCRLCIKLRQYGNYPSHLIQLTLPRMHTEYKFFSFDTERKFISSIIQFPFVEFLHYHNFYYTIFLLHYTV